jgi:hypothetical protein
MKVFFFVVFLHIWRDMLRILHCLLQAKKKTKKFQKGRVAQQKAKAERKPVASEKVIKEVKDWCGVSPCADV